MTGMSFETEPLQLVPVQWSKQNGRSGLRVRDGRFLVLSEATAPGLAQGELASTVEALVRLHANQTQPQSLQALILSLRQISHVPRVRGIHRAVEFLYDNGLIQNASAAHWISALRQDATWRRSFVDTTLFEGPLISLGAGRALREFFIVLTLITGALGLLVSLHLLHQCVTLAQPEITNVGLWAIQGFISISLARSLRAVVQAVLLRGLSGQAQKLTLRLTPVSLSFSASSIAGIENRTIWEGLAALTSISVMATVSYFAFADLGLIAALFTAVAIMIEFSPLAQSPLLETLRYFYSRPKSPLSEKELAGWHTSLSFLWMLLTGALALKMGLRFRQPMITSLLFARTEQNPLQWAGLAIFAWGLISILVAWIEDAIGAPIFGFTAWSDQARTLRSMFRMKVTRADDRPLRTAEDLAQERSTWQRASFLRGLDEPTRKLFLKGASIRTFSAGAFLCRKGERGRELYVILSGEAEVVKRSRAGGSSVVAVLTEGSAFGEVGYFLNEARTADVRALKETVVLCLIPSDELQAMATERFSDLQLRIWFLQALQRNPLFKDIPAEALDTLIFQGTFKRYPPKSAIVKEGDPATFCTFIVQGRGRVFKKSREINTVHQGDLVGEIALLYQTSESGPSVRTASVFAETELLAVELSADAFWATISAQVPLGLVIEELATRRLGHDVIRKQVKRYEASTE